jgi:hypothetical protein
MTLDFGGEIVHWRGPAPFHFVMMPKPEAAELRSSAAQLSYTTALIPKDGTYAVPIKVAVRRAEGLELGDTVRIRLDLDERGLAGPR